MIKLYFIYKVQIIQLIHNILIFISKHMYGHGLVFLYFYCIFLLGLLYVVPLILINFQKFMHKFNSDLLNHEHKFKIKSYDSLYRIYFNKFIYSIIRYFYRLLIKKCIKFITSILII
jgi:hypothetical protein